MNNKAQELYDLVMNTYNKEDLYYVQSLVNGLNYILFDDRKIINDLNKEKLKISEETEIKRICKSNMKKNKTMLTEFAKYIEDKHRFEYYGDGTEFRPDDWCPYEEPFLFIRTNSTFDKFYLMGTNRHYDSYSKSTVNDSDFNVKGFEDCADSKEMILFLEDFIKMYKDFNKAYNEDYHNKVVREKNFEDHLKGFGKRVNLYEYLEIEGGV